MKRSRIKTDPGSSNPGEGTIPTNARPLKICIVFEDDIGARNAEVLIRHVAPNFPCDLRSFAFAELDPPGPGVAAARSASDTDILVVALRDDHAFPEHMQSWLDLCLGLRDQEEECALVVLITKTGGIADPESSLMDYMKTVAAMGGLALFSRDRGLTDILGLDSASQPERLPRKQGLERDPWQFAE